MLTDQVKQARSDYLDLVYAGVENGDERPRASVESIEAAWERVEQAVVRGHRDVARLVREADRVEHQVSSCDTIEGVTYCFCGLKYLVAALVPFKEARE